MEITVKAAAKINLLLDLTAKLENGYHSIFTVMQSVGIYDTVTVKRNNTKKISLSCSESYIPADERNTAWKAAESFFDYIKTDDFGVRIHIDKVIPSEAGLAGGSSDAAAVIAALNILYGTKLHDSELREIANKVGADVPFCLCGGTKLCLNKGEIMAELPDLPDCEIIVVKPGQGISTKEAYKNFDNAEKIRHPDNEGFISAAAKSDLKTMCTKAANVFEQVVEVRDRVKIKAVMRNNNAMLAMMSGSGASVFGIFGNKNDSLKCFGELKDRFENVFTAKPVEKSLIIE